MLGWKGKALRIDLREGNIKEEKIGKERLKSCIGGVGIATDYLYNESEFPVVPLSGGNSIYIFNGPLTGTPVVSSGRFCLVTASPLTNYFLQSHCGGHFGPELKYSGYDGIIIENSSEHPSYISIDDDQIEIRDARHLWGKGVKSTVRKLKSENDPECKVLAIGPAGEGLSLLSNVKSDVYRSLGRGGAGAVFGSKNLKAIVVRGTGPVEVGDPEAVASHILEANEKSKEATKTFTDYGTSNAGIFMDKAGGLPTRNFQLGRFKNVENISGMALSKSIWKGRRSCYSCPIGCSHYSVDGGIRTEGPEYETIFSLGSNIMNDNVDALVEINELCNDIGIDTISYGVTISWLMEASERGLVDEELAWGDMDKVISLLRDIGKGESLSENLANGVKFCSERMGGKDFAIHVKGMELPGYDPRITQGMALAYSLSNRGACHLRAPLYVKEIFQRRMPSDTLDGKVDPLILVEDTMTVMDCLIMCRFASRSLIDESFEGASGLLEMVTGEAIDPKEIEHSSKRTWTQQRLFNIEQGLEPGEDSLPDRFFDSDLDGTSLDRGAFDSKVAEYYAKRGCDDNGIPTEAMLRSLGIAWR